MCLLGGSVCFKRGIFIAQILLFCLLPALPVVAAAGPRELQEARLARLPSPGGRGTWSGEVLGPVLPSAVRSLEQSPRGRLGLC